MLTIYDSYYISRDRVLKTINDLTQVKNYLKNFGKPLDNLIKEGDSIKGVLKIMGFFKIPGSAEVIAKIESIQAFARVVVRDMYNINLDKQIGDLYELHLKIEAFNEYVKKLELENENLREKLRRSK